VFGEKAFWVQKANLKKLILWVFWKSFFRISFLSHNFIKNS